jgi:hypothetical protein
LVWEWSLFSAGQHGGSREACDKTPDKHSRYRKL